jgi:hypothetical protein
MLLFKGRKAMSVSYAGSAAYSTTACNIVMTTGANQASSIIQNVAPPNTFVWGFTYITGSNNSNCTFGWGDSNNALSIQLNHPASNIKLLNNSTLLTQCNSLPIVPYQSNIIQVKQSVSQVKLYINNSLQFAYANPEFNPALEHSK